MAIFTPIPLSLYVHLPWCVRKCPYCDFNSHEAKEALPEALYVNALIKELESALSLIEGRPLVSIFFGGGTPSLFSGKAIATILQQVAKRIAFAPDIEITLEANPGTLDESRFRDFYQAGINRLSLGIQSLQDEKLAVLGRIHNSERAKQAIALAKEVGFTNFNLDIMYGLPNQTLEEALYDVKTALAFTPTHFSWYQLTIEPNTLFHHQPPALPIDDDIWEMQLAGQKLIAAHGLKQYEVSAYAALGKECVHNKNYWEFGDYLGLGAGAHSKITNSDTGQVMRFAQVKHPKAYLTQPFLFEKEKTLLAPEDLIFEFMLNALRLTNGVSLDLFEKRTNLTLTQIESLLKKAKNRGLLEDSFDHLRPTELGKRFLNETIMMFQYS